MTADLLILAASLIAAAVATQAVRVTLSAPVLKSARNY